MAVDFVTLLIEEWQAALLSIYVIGWAVAACLSFAVGANDCANSFGTAVGSGTLSLRKASYLAGFFETFGAIFMSAAVGSTIRKGVFNGAIFSSFNSDIPLESNYSELCPSISLGTGAENNSPYFYENREQICEQKYENHQGRCSISNYFETNYCPAVMAVNSNSKCTYPFSLSNRTEWLDMMENGPEQLSCQSNVTQMDDLVEYQVDQKLFDEGRVKRPELVLAYIHLSAMTGSAIWQIIATRFSLPVSGTHSIIGALIGAGIAGAGFSAINWEKVGFVALSWVTSPTLSCGAAYLIYHRVGNNIIQNSKPLEAVKIMFPYAVSIVGFINAYTLLMIQYKSNKSFSYSDFPIPKSWIKENIAGKNWWFVNPLILALPISVLIYFITKIMVMPKVIQIIERETKNYNQQINEQNQEGKSDLNTNTTNTTETPNTVQQVSHPPTVGAIPEEDSSLLEEYSDTNSKRNSRKPSINQNIQNKLTMQEINSENQNTHHTQNTNNQNTQKIQISSQNLDNHNKIHINQVPPNTKPPMQVASDPNFESNDLFNKSSAPLINSDGSEIHSPPEKNLPTQNSISSTTPHHHTSVLQKVASMGNQVAHVGKFKVTNITHAHHHSSIKSKPSVVSKATMIADLQAKTLNSAANKYHSKSMTNVDKLDQHGNYYSWTGNHPNPKIISSSNQQVTVTSVGHGKGARSTHGSTTGMDDGQVDLNKILNKNLPPTKRIRHASESYAHTSPVSNPPIPIHLKNVHTPFHQAHNTGVVPSALASNQNSNTGMSSTHRGSMKSNHSHALTSNQHSFDNPNLTSHQDHESETEASESRAGEPCDFKLGHEDSYETEEQKFGVNFDENVQKFEFESEKDEGMIVEDYFKRLQVVAACCSALAHGGNDTGNAIAPLIGIYLLYSYGPLDATYKSTWWLFAFGGGFMTVGLFMYGKKCIETMGTNITKVTPSSGFTTSIVAVCVVQICSVLGLPVSSTHCQVGAVIGIGLLGGVSSVKWSLMKNVALAWIFTLPATGLLSFFMVKFLMFCEIGNN